MRKKQAILILKLLLAVGVIAWLLTSGRIDFSELAKVGDGWPWLVASLAPFGILLALCAERWRLLLEAQGIRYTRREAYSLTMIGHFFSQFLIGTTGGDMVKAYVVAVERPARRSEAILSVIADRVVGLWVLVGVALTAMLFNWGTVSASANLRYMGMCVAGGFILSLLGGYAFYSSRVRSSRLVARLVARLPIPSFALKLAAAAYDFRRHPRQWGIALLLSVAVHVCVVVTNVLAARAIVEGPISWWSFFFLIPLAQVAMAIPINPPGAIGTGEAIYSTLLAFAGVPATTGVLICILQRVTNLSWALVGCAAYLRRKRNVEAAVQAAREDEEAEEGAQDEGRAPDAPLGDAPAPE